MGLKNNMTRATRAFSLVELMITLIIISCIIGAMAPIITKKLKSNSVTILKQGEKTAELSQECSRYSNHCLLCTDTLCALCEKTCQIGEYKDSAKCTCETCISKFDSCLKCQYSECTSCDVGHKLNNGLCEICPDGYYQDETGQTTCKICEEDYYCQNGTKTQCETEKGSYEGSSSCSDCPANCIDCENPSLCLTCKEGYYIKDGQCAPCPIGCATCDTDSNCLTCLSEHNKISIGSDYRCVQSSNYSSCASLRCATCQASTTPSVSLCTSYWYADDTTTYPKTKGCCGYKLSAITDRCGRYCYSGTDIYSYCSGYTYEISGCETTDIPSNTQNTQSACTQLANKTVIVRGTILCKSSSGATIKSCDTKGTLPYYPVHVCSDGSW